MNKKIKKEEKINKEEFAKRFVKGLGIFSAVVVIPELLFKKW